MEHEKSWDYERKAEQDFTLKIRDFDRPSNSFQEGS